MEKYRILVVDDEEIIRELLVRSFGENDYHVETVEDAGVALKRIKEDSFNLLITDLKMPKVGGMDVLKEIKNVNPYIEVIIITGYPTIELAVDAVKIGAFDFICKPFDLEQMKTTVAKCLEKQKFSINHVKLGELATLFEISKTININTDIESLLAKILDSALEIVKARKGSILLLDENTRELTIRAARGLSAEVIKNTRIPLGEGIAGRVAEGGKPVLVTDSELDPAFQGNRDGRYSTKSFISIPLLSKYSSSQANVLGVINITEKNSGENFTEREQTLLSILSSQAVAAIKNYSLYSQLQDKIGALERLIKELEKTQSQLIQSEKLEAIGRLASGIAHEVKNPLGVILQGVNYFEANCPSGDEDAPMIFEMIKNNVKRADSIIRALVDFSRAGELCMETGDVNGIIEHSLILVQHITKLENIEITRDLQAGLPKILADKGKIEQVFVNLFTNAVQAMPGGGKLICRSRLAQCNTFEPGEEVIVVEVEDTGEGISQEHLKKLFEPFFTTKGPGKGTGLGLSVTRNIIELHKGAIEIASQVGKGTKVAIRFKVHRGG
jgi:signal transduction histidine kinase/DNA-binding response OmpR family regulator